MEWYKMRADATTHWKIRSVGYKARWLWQLGLSLSARYETDGRLPREMLEAEPEWHDLEPAADELVRVSLWETHPDGGWLVHGWADHNETSESLTKKRSNGATRVRKHRTEKRNALTSENGNALQGVTEPDHVTRYRALQGDVTSPRVTPPELEEELEEELKRPNGRSSDSTADAAETGPPRTPPAPNPAPKPDPHTGFEEFWAVHPRAKGTDASKAKARKAWPAALKRAGGNPRTIIDAAARHRDDPNREPAYTAHAATWLNQDRWESGPIPPRTRAPTPGRGDQFLALAQRLRQADQKEITP